MLLVLTRWTPLESFTKISQSVLLVCPCWVCVRGALGRAGGFQLAVPVLWSPGYVTVVAVPEGARSIKVEEGAGADNGSFLAVTGVQDDVGFLNDKWWGLHGTARSGHPPLSTPSMTCSLQSSPRADGLMTLGVHCLVYVLPGNRVPILVCF